MGKPVLEVRNLKKQYQTNNGVVDAVKGISFHVNFRLSRRQRRRQIDNDQHGDDTASADLRPDPGRRRGLILTR